MNTMHFMKALGEIPEELVRCYFDGMPATTKAPEHVQYKPTVQCRSATQKNDRYASRILAGAVVAACLLFAVGFGVFLPRGMHEHTPVQSAPPASASQPATEPISQAEVSGTRTVPDAMTKDGIRELMLNSTDYYNTVSGEFYYTINDDGDLFILSLECDIDASTAETHVMQVYPTNMEAVKAEAKPVFDTDKVLWSRTQIADGTMWTLTNDLTGETLETGSVITRDQLTHEPLEKRFHINPDGTSSSVQRADPTNTYFARRILTPEELTFSLLCSTDEWDITGTTLYAGRQCAVVSGTAPASYSEKNQIAAYTMYVDNQTGILMRFVGLNAAQKIVKFIYTKQIDISPASAIQSATEPASQTEISGIGV